MNLKRLFLIFTFLITFVFSIQQANAADNYLRTITLEKGNTGYNVILGTDTMAKVTKKTPSENEIIIEMKDIKSSETVNAVYKGTTSIDGLVIENSSYDRLKIYISADNIKYSTVIMETADGSAQIVGETVPLDKILWIVCVLALFSVVFKVAKDLSEEDDKILIKKDIKDREIQLYRKYRSQMMVNPSIDATQSLKMRRMLKKIDRKIDERLTSVIQ
jgi:hypothetical protein